MPTYYPQFANAMIAQPGYSPQMMTKTSIQDCLNGHRTAAAWYGAGLGSYPTGPLYRWTLPYRGLSETERATLESFFASQHGRYGTFIFLDPAGNLCQFSEDFTNAAWQPNGITVTTNGGLSDPFGGSAASLLTGTGSDNVIGTVVIPAGGASGYVLCGSVWVMPSVAQTLNVGFIDSVGNNFGDQSWTLPANVWTRISATVTLATNDVVRFVIGRLTTWGTGVALRLFGAQVVPSIGLGEYAKSPGNYGLHADVRFDQDELEITKPTYNQNDCTVKLAEFFA